MLPQHTRNSNLGSPGWSTRTCVGACLAPGQAPYIFASCPSWRSLTKLSALNFLVQSKTCLSALTMLATSRPAPYKLVCALDVFDKNISDGWKLQDVLVPHRSDLHVASYKFAHLVHFCKWHSDCVGFADATSFPAIFCLGDDRTTWIKDPSVQVLQQAVLHSNMLDENLVSKVMNQKKPISLTRRTSGKS